MALQGFYNGIRGFAVGCHIADYGMGLSSGRRGSVAAVASQSRRGVKLAAVLVCMLLLSMVLLALAECAGNVSDPSRNMHAPAVAAAATCLATTDCPEALQGATALVLGEPSSGNVADEPTLGSPSGVAPERGALIRLRVQCESGACDGQALDWWTGVQWQDAAGGWHDVDGWQGGLDDNSTKTWWVAPRDFGTGPFRWVVYRGRCGAIAGASSSFKLPGAADQVVEAHVAVR